MKLNLTYDETMLVLMAVRKLMTRCENGPLITSIHSKIMSVLAESNAGVWYVLKHGGYAKHSWKVVGGYLLWGDAMEKYHDIANTISRGMVMLAYCPLYEKGQVVVYSHYVGRDTARSDKVGYEEARRQIFAADVRRIVGERGKGKKAGRKVKRKEK